MFTDLNHLFSFFPAAETQRSIIPLNSQALAVMQLQGTPASADTPWGKVR